MCLQSLSSSNTLYDEWSFRFGCFYKTINIVKNMCFWLINGGKNLHQSTTYFFDFLCLLMCFLFVWKPHVPINAKEHFSNSESMFYCYFFSEVNEPFEFGIEIGWFWGQNRHKSHLMKYTLWDGNNLASLIESVCARERVQKTYRNVFRSLFLLVLFILVHFVVFFSLYFSFAYTHKHFFRRWH